MSLHSSLIRTMITHGPICKANCAEGSHWRLEKCVFLKKRNVSKKNVLVTGVVCHEAPIIMEGRDTTPEKRDFYERTGCKNTHFSSLERSVRHVEAASSCTPSRAGTLCCLALPRSG